MNHGTARHTFLQKIPNISHRSSAVITLNGYDSVLPNLTRLSNLRFTAARPRWLAAQHSRGVVDRRARDDRALQLDVPKWHVPDYMGTSPRPCGRRRVPALQPVCTLENTARTTGRVPTRYLLRRFSYSYSGARWLVSQGGEERAARIAQQPSGAGSPMAEASFSTESIMGLERMLADIRASMWVSCRMQKDGRGRTITLARRHAAEEAANGETTRFWG